MGDGHADYACLDYCLESPLQSSMSTVEHLHSPQSTLFRLGNLGAMASAHNTSTSKPDPQCQLNPDINELSGTQKGREL